jgi:uncharacterized protein YndB with AHSA1/START domain
MPQELLTAECGLQNHSQPEPITHREPGDLALSVSLRAETRRVFQALTLPEYLEMWIRIPCAGRLCSVTALQAGPNFALEHCCAGSPTGRITGRYLVCRRRKLLLSWLAHRGFDGRETSLSMRLCGDFGSSTLTLCQSGFRDLQDKAWHLELWQASFAALARLF